MPVRNSAWSVPRALASVRNQTLSDWELLCVDNDSTDGTLDLLEQAASEDHRIKVSKESTLGAGPARNSGLRRAAGDYVAFLDADDQLAAPDTLELLCSTAQRSGALICGGSMIVQVAQQQVLREFEGTLGGFRFDRGGLMNYADYQFDYGFYRFVFRRQLLTEANIVFPGYRRFQDPPFFVRAMVVARSFYAVTQATYIHHFGHQQLEWDEDAVQGLLLGLRDNLELSRKHGLDELHRLTAGRMTFDFSENIDNACRKTNRIDLLRAESRSLLAINVTKLDDAGKESLLNYYRQRENRVSE